jgi:hypothetical protein
MKFPNRKFIVMITTQQSGTLYSGQAKPGMMMGHVISLDEAPSGYGKSDNPVEGEITVVTLTQEGIVAFCM